jgi:large subunit ribosomal protein L22
MSMEVKAKARYIRMSPKKVRLVAGLVRGMGVGQAEAHLGLTQKAAALPVLKLLRSAIANAEHNFKLEKADLFIKEISVDGGPVLKRFKPRAFGRAGSIRKRTSHINLTLADRTAKGDAKQGAGLKAAVVKADDKKPAAKKAEEKPAAKKAAKGDAKKPTAKAAKSDTKKAPAKKPAAKKATTKAAPKGEAAAKKSKASKE